jgi:DNA-binding response OmpR family regulator
VIAPAPERTAPSSPCVLVVDDDKDLRDLLSDRLRRKGFSVRTADDGAEAIDVYRLNREMIDIVLMDVCMPVLDGPGALAALKLIAPEICCCFMSGGLGRYTEAGLLELGAAGVMMKPFRTDDLSLALTQLVRRHREAAEGRSPTGGAVREMAHH